MCDQNDNQMMMCQPSQQCEYFECPEGDKFENAENCYNCEDPTAYTPDCDQCYVSPSGGSNQQFDSCFQPPDCYDPCVPCYDPCQPRCDPCPPRCDPCPPRCDPCPPRCEPCPPPCSPCFKPCDPCQPIGPAMMPCGVNPCEPRYPCPPECSPYCSPFSRRRYVQPPRRESCKPVVRYQPPTVAMTDDTVYRKSFDFIDSQTAASCRLPPARPIGQLRSPCGDFAKETVTRLSFQPFCCPERAQMIYPRSPSLLGQGPMQGLTTQKHDFVPKFQYQRVKCTPRDNIHRPCGCVERTTIQRLSYMSPDLCKFSRAESCKPIISYKPPDLPMEFETTQKLSFMPNCPAPKEEYPWARRSKYCPPSVKFAKDTVAKLSYQPPGCFLDDKAVCCEVQCDGSPRAAC